MRSETNYWLVGAMYDGSDDQSAAFYRRGYWEMGWNDADQPSFASKRDLIEPGDRIAVKSRRGQGSPTITIKGLGIVKEVFEGKVFVDWKVTDLSREVPSKGCYGTIHGPYTITGDPEWVKTVFCL